MLWVAIIFNTHLPFKTQEQLNFSNNGEQNPCQCLVFFDWFMIKFFK
jgi:hypothetical protein